MDSYRELGLDELDEQNEVTQQTSQIRVLYSRLRRILQDEGITFPIDPLMRGWLTLPHLENVDECVHRLRKAFGTSEERKAAAIGLVEAALTVNLILGVTDSELMEGVGC